jgi:hypothetical protein
VLLYEQLLGVCLPGVGVEETMNVKIKKMFKNIYEYFDLFCILIVEHIFEIVFFGVTVFAMYLALFVLPPVHLGFGFEPIGELFGFEYIHNPLPILGVLFFGFVYWLGLRRGMYCGGGI